jgi:hypothetical protein
MARPRKKIDRELVEALAAIGCKVTEIAAVLNCSTDTLHKRFAVNIAKGGERLKISLRRMQYQSAMNGNISMQIWLGKQYLNQRDKMEFDIHEVDRLLAIELARVAGTLEDADLPPLDSNLVQ